MKHEWYELESSEEVLVRSVADLVMESILARKILGQLLFRAF